MYVTVNEKRLFLAPLRSAENNFMMFFKIEVRVDSTHICAEICPTEHFLKKCSNFSPPQSLEVDLLFCLKDKYNKGSLIKLFAFLLLSALVRVEPACEKS